MMNLYNSTKGRITGRRKELAILRFMGMTTVAQVLVTIVTHNKEKSQNILEDIRKESV